MKRLSLLLVLCGCCTVLSAQSENTRLIMGTIADQVTLMPLIGESTICLMHPDSTTMVTEGMVFVNKAGNKEFTSFYVFANEPGKYLIRVLNPFYHPLYYPIDVKFYKREQYIDGIRLYMKRKLLTDNIELGEVTVTATKLKFYFDKDTLIYNAEQFVTQEGFVLNDILKKMPGIEIQKDGTILSNGKKVSYLLMNGKDFFNKDRKTILENLPAFMVKSVKVYDKTLDPDAVIEREKSMQGLTMDIKLKKQYDESSLASIDVGYGTDSRYYGKLFGLNYSPNHRVSAYVTSNNVNHDDIIGENGDANNRGENNGDKETSKAGFNYNFDNPQGKYELEGKASLQYVEAKTEMNSKSQMFFIEGDYYARQLTDNTEKPLSFATKHRFALFNNKPYSFTISPSISYDKKKSTTLSATGNFCSDVDTLLGVSWLDTIVSRQESPLMSMYGINRNVYQTELFVTSSNAAIDLEKKIHIPHCSDVFALNAKVMYQKSRTDLFNQQDIEIMNPHDAIWSNLYQKTNSSEGDVKFGATYTYSISPLSSVIASLGTEYRDEANESPIYKLDELDGFGPGTAIPIAVLSGENILSRAFDERNSSQFKLRNAKQTGNISYNATRQNRIDSITHKRTISVSLPIRFEHNELSYFQYRMDTVATQNKVMPEFILSYQHQKSKDLATVRQGISYSYAEALPSLLQTVDVVNDAVPMLSSHGNPNLKATQKHTFEASYYSMPSFDEFHSYSASYLLKNRDITEGVIYDKNTGAIKSMPMNTSWTDQLMVMLLDNHNIGKTKSSQICNRFIFISNNMESYFDSMGDDFRTIRSIRSTIFNENLSFVMRSSNSKRSMTFEALAHYTMMSDIQNELSSVNLLDIGFTWSGYLELPYNMRLQSNITEIHRTGYTYTSINGWECTWNATLTKAFKNNITLQLDAFDLLNQRKSTTQNITTLSRVEYDINNLGRYVMLHLIWRINSKPAEEHAHSHDHVH